MRAALESGCGERCRRRAIRLALVLLLAVPGAASLAVPASAPASAQAIESLLSQNEVTEMEELLDRLSFNPGQIDGTVDADTERAIKAYQEFAILPVDGLASRALLNELRAVAGHLDARKPTEQVEAEKKAAEKKAAEAEAAAAEKA
ncbi:MAG: peptidoglycan-binding domain-containing protein, partial [Kiloniellales bacterium]